jgi:signal transduction histidine kinase
MTSVLLKDLLDLSQMENNKFVLNKQLVNIEMVCMNSLQVLGPRLEMK